MQSTFFRNEIEMKILVAVFAGITFFAALLGFTTHAIPIYSLLGKMAAGIAFFGLIITAAAYVAQDVLPHTDFSADDIHP